MIVRASTAAPDRTDFTERERARARLRRGRGRVHGLRVIVEPCSAVYPIRFSTASQLTFLKNASTYLARSVAR